MREIKFRGWHTSQKIMFSPEEMTVDQLTLLPIGQFINVHDGSTRLSQIFPQDKFIPLQYTGLKDKNSKEVYEGDILELEGIRSFVVYWESSTGFRFNSYMPYGTINALYEAITEGAVVIGDIYQNPELLK